jgi:hypothetical protein
MNNINAKAFDGVHNSCGITISGITAPGSLALFTGPGAYIFIGSVGAIGAIGAIGADGADGADGANTSGVFVLFCRDLDEAPG